MKAAKDEPRLTLEEVSTAAGDELTMEGELQRQLDIEEVLEFEGSNLITKGNSDIDEIAVLFKEGFDKFQHFTDFGMGEA
eukprot:3950404-Pyramimonas_sp.AAC.1